MSENLYGTQFLRKDVVPYDVFLWKVVAGLGWTAEQVQHDLFGQINGRLRNPAESQAVATLVDRECGTSIRSWITSTLKEVGDLRKAGKQAPPGPTGMFSVVTNILGFMFTTAAWEAEKGLDMNRYKRTDDALWVTAALGVLAVCGSGRRES
jgi:hypothetical protein